MIKRAVGSTSGPSYPLSSTRALLDCKRPNDAGYLSWPADAMAKYFAPDLSPEAQAVLAATQGPTFAGAFDGKVTAPAYAAKPTWSVISDQDQIIPPLLQEAFAGKMGATVVHVPSSHVPMLSQPQAVADAILTAVDGVK